MLPLNFGAPALVERAVLDFLSKPLLGETAVINTARRAVCRKHSLTCFPVCYRTLDTPALEGIAVLDFIRTQLRVAFSGDTAVRGEGRLLP
jgi:hypothetical protein